MISRRGAIYRQLGRYEEALIDFRHAIELEPQDDWYHYLYALVCQTLSQQDRASAAIMTAIDFAQASYAANKLNWNNTFNLALYLAFASQTAEAVTIVQDAIASGAPPTSIRLAIQDFDELLQTLPDHTVAREIQELLKQHLANAEGEPADSDKN